MQFWFWDLLLKSPRLCSGFRKRQLGRAKNGKPFVHLARRDCTQLFLIYGGMDAYARGGLVAGMGLFEFLKATGLSQRNLSWIRDPYLDNFQCGISPEVPDVPAMVEWHRSYLQKLPHVTQIYTLGYSSGCYGALLFGHLLGATKVFAFSPRTAHMKGDQEARIRLRDQLAESNGVTTYDIHYAEKNTLDRTFAELLQPCPGVKIHSYRQYGSTHFLLNYLSRDDLLRTILPPFEGTAPAVAAPPAAPESV